MATLCPHTCKLPSGRLGGEGAGCHPCQLLWKRPRGKPVDRHVCIPFRHRPLRSVHPSTAEGRDGQQAVARAGSLNREALLQEALKVLLQRHAEDGLVGGYRGSKAAGRDI